jgi:hypothetical protein
MNAEARVAATVGYMQQQHDRVVLLSQAANGVPLVMLMMLLHYLLVRTVILLQNHTSFELVMVSGR